MTSLKTQIASLLKQHFYIDGTWDLNAQGLVDVYGDVRVREQHQNGLYVAFGHVTGSFICEAINLHTLKGAPHSVGENFVCMETNLRTLEGAPQVVPGKFHVGNNQLTSMQGGPMEVGGDCMVYRNHLTSLEGAPQSVGGRFIISYYPDTPLLNLFNYKQVRFLLTMGARSHDIPQIWQDLFNPELYPDLQGGGRMAQIKAVAILSKAGLYKGNPNARQ